LTVFAVQELSDSRTGDGVVDNDRDHKVAHTNARLHTDVKRQVNNGSKQAKASKEKQATTAIMSTRYVKLNPAAFMSMGLYTGTWSSTHNQTQGEYG
jgi:hypothetical protein